jgi:phospholipid/cholesterol/gamma-HCH transport system permease protein
MSTVPALGELTFRRTPDAELVIEISGDWRLHEALPDLAPVEAELVGAAPPRAVVVDAGGLGEWDSSVLVFLSSISALAGERGVPVDRRALPVGIQRLLELAEAVPEKEGARQAEAEASLLERIGTRTISAQESFVEMLHFLGDATLTFGKMLRRAARFRRSDLLMLMQQVGAEAVGIVTLISFLVGLILAFIGAAQLQQFGAAIYVADLVGIGMVRDVAALMTAIVMAGRTGAAYAAELGSMKVTQEIDALTTMGISPLEFLVLPRIVALVLMMPLLTLYADLVGVLGGAFVGVTMLDLSISAYMQETASAVSVLDLVGGMFKGTVYGALIAVAGCLRGMQSGTSSSAVGVATTSAVVTAIVWIISACGAFAVLFYALGI